MEVCPNGQIGSASEMVYHLLRSDLGKRVEGGWDAARSALWVFVWCGSRV